MCCCGRYSCNLIVSPAQYSHIDSLRRERMLFQDIHKKLQRALTRKKQEMAELISIISDSHEAREKVCHHLGSFSGLA